MMLVYIGIPYFCD